MEKVFCELGTQKNAGYQNILISDKVDKWISIEKPIRREKLRSYILTEGTVKAEVIIIINIHAPNTDTPNSIKQIRMDTKSQTNINKNSVGEFNTPCHK